MSSEPNASATSGLDANLAGLLCYLFTWVSGLIFLVIDKRPSVRFHAAQSIAMAVAFVVSMIAFWIVTFILAFITGGFGVLLGFLFPLFFIGYFVISIICMIKAYKGEKFKLPIVGNIAEKMGGN